ncbi:MAG: phasin family protein [Rhodospirillales bacterium]|nr:phasin family protein [Rhodospirillales bacterium]
MNAKTKANAADPVKNAAETLETVTAVGKETVEAVIAMSTEVAQEGYSNASAYGKEQLVAAKNRYEKAASAGKENFDACTAASTAAFAGFEAFCGQMLNYTKRATAENTDIVQRFYAAKTPQEVVELQFEAVNNSVNRVVAQSTELNKITADAVTKTVEPLKTQFDSSVEAFSKPFAV